MGEKGIRAQGENGFLRKASKTAPLSSFEFAYKISHGGNLCYSILTDSRSQRNLRIDAVPKVLTAWKTFYLFSGTISRLTNSSGIAYTP